MTRADILVRAGIIVECAVGLSADVDVLDVAGDLVIPGLINAHLHSPGNFMRGTLEGLPLEVFMLFEVPPLASGIEEPAKVRLRTLIGAAEMLKLGITSVMDDAFFVWTSLDKRFGQYKEGFPQGRHLPQAMIAEADTGTAALAIYRKGAVAANRQGDPRLVTAMLSTLRILNNEHTRTLPLSFGGEADKDISRWTRAPEELKTRAQAINDPEILGLSPGAASTAKGALSAAFLEAVGVVGAIDVREPRPGESDSEAPVRLALTYRIFKGQRIYQDQTKRKGQYLELDIDWTLTFRWPVEPRLGEVSITLHTTPSPTFNSFAGSADVVYASMLAENAKNLGPALRQALGLVPPPAEAPE